MIHFEEYFPTLDSEHSEWDINARSSLRDENGVKFSIRIISPKKEVKILSRLYPNDNLPNSLKQDLEDPEYVSKLETYCHQMKIEDRRRWKPFGKAADDEDKKRTNRCEDTYFVLTNPELRGKYSDYCSKYCPDTGIDDKEQETKFKINCKYCQGSHLSHTCALRPETKETDVTDTTMTSDATLTPTSTFSSNSTLSPGTGKYIPPHLKNRIDNGDYNDRGGRGNRGDRGNREGRGSRGSRGGRGNRGGGRGRYEKAKINAIKINNIVGYATEEEVKELCSSYGGIYKFSIHGGDWGKYAFVTYSRQEYADQALQELNGYRFENMFLAAEMASY